MMKAMLFRIMAVIMVLPLLVSTTSWTVGKHYCKGHLIAVSFFSHAEDCGMDTPISGNTDTVSKSESCCSNEIFVLDGQDILKISLNDLHLDGQLFSSPFIPSYFNLFEARTEKWVPHEHYPPPVLIEDIHMLDQVFLI